MRKLATSVNVSGKNRATAQPRNRAIVQGTPSSRQIRFPVSVRPASARQFFPPERLKLPATRLTHLPVWLTPPAAWSVQPAIRLARLTARLKLSIIWLARPAARLDGATAPINHLSARLKRPAMPVNPPAARFFAKIMPKVAKTACFPRPATPAAQKTTVLAGAAARRDSVLDCGSPLPLSSVAWRPKRQRTAALQNLADKPAATLHGQHITKNYYG